MRGYPLFTVRGAVIGPLVIAGALAEEKDLPRLKAIGVKDSKLLTAEKREKLYPQIKKILKDFAIIKISAKQIDELRKRINLNKIEAEKMAQIIKVMRADKAIVDAPQVSTEKFKDYLNALAKNKTEIVAENFADRKYVIVAAASILAKVERDREIREIEKKNKIFVRTGYPHDENTINFLKSCKGRFPDFVRKSWITVQEMLKKKKQTTLKEFK